MVCSCPCTHNLAHYGHFQNGVTSQDLPPYSNGVQRSQLAICTQAKESLGTRLVTCTVGLTSSCSSLSRPLNALLVITRVPAGTPGGGGGGAVL